MLREKKPSWVLEEGTGQALLRGATRRIISAIRAKGRRCMRPHLLPLLAPLALLLAAFTTPGQQKTPPTGGWQQTQKGDAAHDNSTTQFTLPGKFLTRPEKDAGNPPELVVNCKPHRSRGKFSSAYVNVGAPLNIEYVEPDEIKAGTSYFPKVSVQYRLNDRKEEKEQWTPGTEKTSASIPKPALVRMLRAQTVQISVQKSRGGEISMQFDLPDATQLGTTCDLPSRRK
jgi:hypothetical protein